MKRYFLCKLIISVVAFTFIFTQVPVIGKTVKGGKGISNKKIIKSMLGKITSINKKSPETLSLGFIVQGKIKNKKFKALGKAQYDSSKEKFYVIFRDFIFKSTINMMFREGNKLNFYYPVEKRLVKDNAETIDLRNYINIKIDFNIIYTLVLGKIPLLNNYKVKKLLKRNKRLYLILENENYYETISFNGNAPDKILFIEKHTKDKLEIYLKKVKRIKGSQYFKYIKVIAGKSKVKVSFRFNRIKINKPVKVKSIKNFKLPGRVKILEL